MAAVGTTVSAFAIARLLLNLPSGLLADRIGRRPLLVVGPAITGLGMIGSAVAGTFPELLAWRFITGAGSALQMSGSQLFLADVSNRENRAKTLGTNQAKPPAVPPDHHHPRASATWLGTLDAVRTLRRPVPHRQQGNSAPVDAWGLQHTSTHAAKC